MRRLLLGLGLLLSACASGAIVDRKPPPPKQEERPLKPSSDVIWQDGHWAYDSSADHFYWVSGLWARPQRNRIWIAGYWEAVDTDQGQGWQWVEARWEDVPQ
jgi:hypothetical protein